MERRKFLALSGSSVISGTAFLGSISSSGIAVEFQIGEVPDKNPRDVDSILIELEKLVMKPQYMDTSRVASVELILELSTGDKKVKDDNILLDSNGSDLSNKSEFQQIKIEDVNNSSADSIRGSIRIKLGHPDVSDEWVQFFTISESTSISTVTTDASLNNQSISITVYEDESGDGTADNSENISIGDGTNQYSLSNISGGVGNSYWIGIDMSSTVEKTPVLKSVSLENVGSWSTVTDWNSNQSESGVVHESVANTSYDNGADVRKGLSAESPFKQPQIFCPLNETSGGTAYNFGNSGVNGTVGNVTQGVDGILGTTAYRFSGTDSSNSGIDLGDADVVQGGSMTALAWVRVQDFNAGTSSGGHFSSHGQIVGKQGSSSNSSDDNYELGVLDNGSVGWYCESNGDDLSIEGGSVSKNSWHMLAGRYDKSNGDMSLIVDESTVATGEISSGGVDPNNNSVGIGYAPGSNYGGNYFTFNGDIAFVYIWDEYLTGTEIQRIYDSVVAQSSLTTSKKTN